MVVNTSPKLDVLRTLSFGERIAEDEIQNLEKYFVETDQWNRVYSGNVSVVYGPKGSGKSAIYSLLNKRIDSLFDQKILVIQAENPRGAPAFAGLVTDPPADENTFRNLWKIYILTLIAKTFREFGIKNAEADRLVKIVMEAGLLPDEESTLASLIRLSLDYVRLWLKPKSIEGEIKVDPATGSAVGFGGKITLAEPGQAERAQGLVSVDSLLSVANAALSKSNYRCWLVLDRLDTAFTEVPELERNALRALFRVYLDLLSLDRISLIVFLRTDIWKRISEGGFREASHITRSVSISWNEKSLLSLIIRRILGNTSLVDRMNIKSEEILANQKLQEDLFYRLFPKQVDAGPRKTTTLRWMCNHVADGTGSTAPRELIHLLNRAKEIQIQKLEIGENAPEAEVLIDRAALREALFEVSKVRLDQTLRAEYPDLSKYVDVLKGQKTEQNLGSLKLLWDVDAEKAEKIADALTDIGFFQKRTAKTETTYWVPFLYRPGLDMVQGKVDGIEEGISDTEEELSA